MQRLKRLSIILLISYLLGSLACKPKQETEAERKARTAQEEDLCAAVVDNNFQKAYLLIQRGANVNTTACGHNYTPLHYAILGATPDYPQPFSFSARKNRDDIIDALIEKGAEVNARSEQGWTPLLFAHIIDDDKLLYDKLISLGASIDVIDEKGKSIADWDAEKKNNPVMAALIKYDFHFNFEKIAREREKDAIKGLVQEEKKQNH